MSRTNPLDEYADDDRPDPNLPIISITDLRVLLRMSSDGAARSFARGHLKDARLPAFGTTKWRFSRRKVLEILGA